MAPAKVQKNTDEPISVAEYMKEEANYAFFNLDLIEREMRAGMDRFLKVSGEHGLKKCQLGEIVGNYDRLLREVEDARKANDLFEIKKLTVFMFVLLTKLNYDISHFARRYKKVIDENRAAAKLAAQEEAAKN